MEGRCIIEAETAQPAAVLRWRTGPLGCLFPVCVIASVFFGAAAFLPALADNLSDGRMGALFAWSAHVSVAGVNLPLLVLALAFGWETIRMGWQWVDEVAFTATAQALVPHRSLRMKPMRWEDIRDVRVAPYRRSRGLFIQLRNGRGKTVGGVETEGEAVERFLQEVRRRIGPDREQAAKADVNGRRSS